MPLRRVRTASICVVALLMGSTAISGAWAQPSVQFASATRDGTPDLRTSPATKPATLSLKPSVDERRVGAALVPFMAPLSLLISPGGNTVSFGQPVEQRGVGPWRAPFVGDTPATDLDLPELLPPPIVSTPAVTPAPGLDALTMAAALKLFAAEPVLARQRAADRAAIVAFYAARNDAPLWIDIDRFSARARSTLSRLDRAAEDGLDLGSQTVPILRDPTTSQLAEAELALSEAAVLYGREAGGARLDPLRINRLITARRTMAEPGQILSAIASATDPGVALQAFNPQQPGYLALRAKLSELRQKALPIVRESIPSGPTLRLGMRDPRVPLVRSRFGLDLPSAADAADAADGLVYDTQVAAAVTAFQKTFGLPASGLLTPRTINALSGGNPTRLENELVANMERWRWMPRDLGPTHLQVNIPDYSLDVVEDGRVVHHARVIVGKPDHQTPVFSNTMRFLIVNPYWNVPLSIINKEMLPKLAADPDYFVNHGYEVVERDGTTYVRQPPGDDNALGRIKFMFPNEHSVYLHDTNARALFASDRRAFSHGCVRVDDPFKLAAVVLGQHSGWSERRVKSLIGGDERTINLPTPMPIHISYFTAFVDEAGQLQLRDDVYGYSAKVKAALALRD